VVQLCRRASMGLESLLPAHRLYENPSYADNPSNTLPTPQPLRGEPVDRTRERYAGGLGLRVHPRGSLQGMESGSRGTNNNKLAPVFHTLEATLQTAVFRKWGFVVNVLKELHDVRL